MELFRHPELPNHVITDTGVMVYVPARRKLKTSFDVSRNRNRAYCFIKCPDGVRRKIYHDDFKSGAPLLAPKLTHEMIYKERGGVRVPGFEDYAIDDAGVVYRVRPFRNGKGRKVPFILNPTSRFSKEYLVLREHTTGERRHMSVDKIRELVEQDGGFGEQD